MQSVSAQNKNEYYQALFLLKFLKYTNRNPPPKYYTIGVVGNSLIIPHLKRLTKNKKINGKYVKFNKVSSYTNIDKYSLLYIPKSQNQKFRTIVAKTKGKKVLIVTEDGRLIYQGAAISFYNQNNRLQFRINPKSINRHNIQVSNRLLAVGQVVNR